MDTSNIVSSARIQGFRISKYLGVVYSGPFASYQNLLADVVSQGNSLKADWIVSFSVQSSVSESRVDRTFSGFGTAVRVKPRS